MGELTSTPGGGEWASVRGSHLSALSVGIYKAIAVPTTHTPATIFIASKNSKIQIHLWVRLLCEYRTHIGGRAKTNVRNRTNE